MTLALSSAVAGVALSGATDAGGNDRPTHYFGRSGRKWSAAEMSSAWAVGIARRLRLTIFNDSIACDVRGYLRQPFLFS